MSFVKRITGLVDDWIGQQVDPDGRLRQLQTPTNEFGFDAFGFHADYVRRALLPMKWVYRSYFRVQCFGIEKVPATGRLFLIANHSGQLPLDGGMILLSMIFDKEPPRIVRTMVEKWVASIPFVSYVFARWGQIIGIPDNCRELLDEDEAILVFPEGVRGISKTYDQAYQLQDFGLGFMRLALEKGVPIVPVGVVGAEEQLPALANLKKLGALIGAPAFPVTPTFPLLGPVGLLPLPVRYRIYYGEPMTFTGDPNDEDEVIEEKVNAVKDAIQALLRRGLSEREHVFW